MRRIGWQGKEDAAKMREKMDELIDSLCRQGDYMCLNVLVQRDGETVYSRAAGYADREREIPARENTIFHLYSMSKPVTAAAVMKLWEDGLLDLMDPLTRYLPAFRDQPVREDGRLVPRQGEITIQDLLNMTSGIPYPDGEETPEMSRLFEEAISKAEGPDAIGTVELANRIAQTPLMFQPGTRWRYGASADILGAVVEVVSGMRFGEYLRREFFEPLGMEDTGFFIPPEKKDRLAVIYRMPCGGEPVAYHDKHLVILDAESDPAFESGGAGLVSTAKDYAAFMTMLMREGTSGGRRYLHPSTVRFLHSGRLTPRQQETFDWPRLRGYTYGNLMRVLESPQEQCVVCQKGEYGWDGWAGTYMEIHPEEKVCALIMTAQIDRETDCARRMLRNGIYRWVL